MHYSLFITTPTGISSYHTAATTSGLQPKLGERSEQRRDVEFFAHAHTHDPTRAPIGEKNKKWNDEVLGQDLRI
jgi:adenine C2-methylase RlmN of 23S rRNA A2503 and tRNA A37